MQNLTDYQKGVVNLVKSPMKFGSRVKLTMPIGSGGRKVALNVAEKTTMIVTRIPDLWKREAGKDAAYIFRTDTKSPILEEEINATLVNLIIVDRGVSVEIQSKKVPQLWLIEGSIPRVEIEQQ